MKLRKIALSLLLIVSMMVAMTGTALAAEPVTVTLDVTNAAELKAALYDKMKEINSGTQGTNLIVNIKNDIDMGDVQWEAQGVNSYGRYFFLTINGNGNTITGLKNMLVSGTWAGKGGLKISDLTLEKANIVFNPEDNPENNGVGAFVGYPSASGGHVTLENCSLINSHVEGGHWTGGLIGYTAGYSGNDGPVFMEVNINNCTVIGNTITGKGSVGSVIGHGLGDAWTGVTIANTFVSGNEVTSTGSSKEKAGALVGTIGTAGNTGSPNNYEPKTGYLRIEDTTVLENTVTSGGTEINRIYGRPGSATEITISGGLFELYEADQQGGYNGLNIIMADNPIFKEDLCVVTFVDGVNGEVFGGNILFYCGKGEPTPEFEVPTREGYTFAGWSPALAATVTADATYTAQWTAVTAATPTPAAPVAPTATPAPAPKTGDSTPIAMLTVVLMASAAAMVWMVANKRKANQQ